MSFLPISVIAYTFNALAILIDKILLKESLPNPLTYTFYICVLQFLAVLLIPFGFQLEISDATFIAISAGIIGVLALYSFFMSLKINEASVVGPVVGVINPLTAMIFGGILLHQVLAPHQYLAVLILVSGTLLVTHNLWKGQVRLNKQMFWMLMAGLLFGISYLLLRETFLRTSFINGIVVSRIAAGLTVLPLFFISSLRQEILSITKSHQSINSHTTLILVISGQSMGALSGLLLTYATSLANPALVNSLFGVQYIVILGVSILLSKRSPNLLNEKLTKTTIAQKIIGVGIMSIGLYLLTK